MKLVRYGAPGREKPGIVGDDIFRLADPIDEKLLNLPILEAVEKNALARPAIAPRSAGLLVVGFERARQVEMNDKADIGLVDAHAECDRRDRDRARRVHESFLIARP